MVLAFGIRAAIVLLALGLLDYLYQRWQHRQDLKMTRRDLLRELRRTEADPHIRRKRREMMEAAYRQRS